jgi:Holliday junction resolvase RusA-like endonuclease
MKLWFFIYSFWTNGYQLFIRPKHNSMGLKSSFVPDIISIEDSVDIINGTWSPRSIYLIVPGEPRPLSRHMFSRGRMYNPSAKYQKDFLEVAKPFLPPNPLTGPLNAEILFYFSRPKSHYRTGKYNNELKKSAPSFHSGRCDLDNLIKFVLDSLNKHAYEDDSQISVIRSAKYYTNDKPSVHVKLAQILQMSG